MTGNDVFVGGGGFDELIGEGGDDIFVGSDAQDKMDGMSGFDWVTYKNDHFGVSADLDLLRWVAWAKCRSHCLAVRGIAQFDPGSLRRGRGSVGYRLHRHPARR